MKRTRNLFLSLLILTLLGLDLAPASAQSDNPPVDPNGAWSDVMNADGTLNYDNLTDGGVVTQPADWMPDIPFVGPIDAEYHVYYTSNGNTILMPTLSTLVFMASNPGESGYLDAVSTLGTNGVTVGVNAPNGAAGLGALISAFTGTPGGDQMMQAINQAGYNGPTAAQDFFTAVANGQTDIWSMGPAGLLQFLDGLAQSSINDFQNGDGLNLYTYMLLYPPGQCASVPGGCTPEQLALLQTLIPPMDDEDSLPAPGECPAPVVVPGRIIRSGELLAPNYPLVVGQDPDKRGVDVLVSVVVQPTIRTYWTPEPVIKCKPGPNGNGVTNCTTDNGQAGHNKIVDWTCEEHVETYPECVSLASMTLRLTPESKDWILNELSIRYPGAYLHKPVFSFGATTGCQWTETYTRVSIEDPGNWDININGQTSGTPVSAPRPFGGAAGQFGVWLKEIAIIK